MGIIRAIWAGILGTWIHIGERLFPPTIHPMLVHFPIVMLYLALVSDLLGRLKRSSDRFFDRASFWLLVLGFLGGVAAAAAGVISEQYVKWTPTTQALLGAHQRDAVLTGLLALLALASRLMARYPYSSRGRQQWSVVWTGRGRSSSLATVLLLATVIMVTWTASIGGTMVYQYGVGIKHVTFRSPLASPSVSPKA